MGKRKIQALEEGAIQQQETKATKKAKECLKPLNWRRIVKRIEELKTNHVTAKGIKFWEVNGKVLDEEFGFDILNETEPNYRMFGKALEATNNMRYKRWKEQLKEEEENRMVSKTGNKSSHSPFIEHEIYARHLLHHMSSVGKMLNKDAVKDVFRAVSEILVDDMFLKHYPDAKDATWRTYTQRHFKEFASTKAMYRDKHHDGCNKPSCTNTVYCSSFIREVRSGLNIFDPLIHTYNLIYCSASRLLNRISKRSGRNLRL